MTLPRASRSSTEKPDATINSCNDNSGLIELTATLENVVGDYGQDKTSGRVSFPRDQLTSSFSEDGNFLIMSKVLGGDGCTKVKVDGVDVCSEVDEKLTLQCKYSLDDLTIGDKFQVTGQDTSVTAEGSGTLDYR